jgi:hypothetical protein
MRIIFILSLALLLIGCGASSKANIAKQRREACRARKSLDRKIESLQRQFTFYNNQIIIFENIN